MLFNGTENQTLLLFSSFRQMLEKSFQTD